MVDTAGHIPFFRLRQTATMKNEESRKQWPKQLFVNQRVQPAHIKPAHLHFTEDKPVIIPLGKAA